MRKLKFKIIGHCKKHNTPIYLIGDQSICGQCDTESLKINQDTYREWRMKYSSQITEKEKQIKYMSKTLQKRNENKYKINYLNAEIAELKSKMEKLNNVSET